MIREDDMVKILEGLMAMVVAVHEDEVVVETDDGRPKWIKRSSLRPSTEKQKLWIEVTEAA